MQVPWARAGGCRFSWVGSVVGLWLADSWWLWVSLGGVWGVKSSGLSCADPFANAPTQSLAQLSYIYIPAAGPTINLPFPARVACGTYMWNLQPHITSNRTACPRAQSVHQADQQHGGQRGDGMQKRVLQGHVRNELVQNQTSKGRPCFAGMCKLRLM